MGGLGLDETAWLRAGATRHTAFVTGFVDIIGGRLLDIVAGRSARVVEDWLAARSEDWLAGVHTVTIDPHRGYANGVAEKLAHATLVVDPFHAVRLANMARSAAGCSRKSAATVVARVIRSTASAACCCGATSA